VALVQDDIDTLKHYLSEYANSDDRASLERVIAVVEPLVGLTDEQLAYLIKRLPTGGERIPDVEALDALAKSMEAAKSR
jgi:hypothetical protein